MYNNASYEEYMRSTLGYMPTCMQGTCATNDYYIMRTNNNNCMNNCNLDELYPDIYKKVYPLVRKQCNTNTMPMTNEILEQMTDSVLNQIKIDLKIETNVKVEKRNEETKTSNLRQQETNKIGEDRVQRRNDTLRDLIKILILNELLNQRIFPGIRPPFLGEPIRPPIQGPRPPFTEGRPPFMEGPGNIRPREF